MADRAERAASSTRYAAGLEAGDRGGPDGSRGKGRVAEPRRRSPNGRARPLGRNLGSARPRRQTWRGTQAHERCDADWRYRDDRSARGAGPPANRATLRQIPLVQGALVSLDPRTGRVLAMVG